MDSHLLDYGDTIAIIRQEIYGYADLWNAHTIRQQVSRPAVVPGKPVVLYFHPPAPAVCQRIGCND